MSLKDFVRHAVETLIDGPASKQVVPPVARRIAKLPARSQKLIEHFTAIGEIAPDFYFSAIEQYVAGMLALFRRVDKRIFEESRSIKAVRS